MKKTWLFGFFFLFFAAIASYTPYMVLYYQSLGFSGAQIGILTGVLPLLTLVSVPFWTRQADRNNQHKLILGIALLVTVACLAVFPALKTFIVVATVIVFLNGFSSPTLAFVNSATMYMLGDEKDTYGRIRLGGTIGFGVAAYLVGVLVENNGLQMAFWVAAVLLLLGFLVSLNFKYGGEQNAKSKNTGLQDLLKDPNWTLFLVIGVTGGIAFSASNTYFFPFMKEIGANEATMGLTLSIGTIAEIPVLLWANRLIGRYKAYGILIMSMAFTGLRLIFFAIAGNPAIVMLIC
jgi:MFS transporter, PPP family, 3-phenylpropionic acid transporter